MKLQIDTDNKTITIEESINLGDLFDALFEMFPKFGWKGYTLVPVKTIEHWTNPITYPTRPWNELPWVIPGTAPLYPLTNPDTGAPAYPSQPWTISCGATSYSVGAGSTTTTKLDNKNVTRTTSVHNIII